MQKWGIGNGKGESGTIRCPQRHVSLLLLTSAFLLLTFQEARWVAGYNGVGWNVFGDDAAGADDGLFANGHAAEQGGTRPDRCTPFDERRDALPVGSGLQCAIAVGGAWEPVVDESNIMSHKHFVLDDHAFTDKGVTGDLAALADPRVFLDLNEGPDFRIVADVASVEVGEPEDTDVLAEFDVGRDLLVERHRGGDGRWEMGILLLLVILGGLEARSL